MILILGFFSLLVLFSYHKSIRQCCRTKNCVANRFSLHNKREKLKLKKNYTKHKQNQSEWGGRLERKKVEKGACKKADMSAAMFTNKPLIDCFGFCFCCAQVGPIIVRASTHFFRPPPTLYFCTRGCFIFVHSDTRPPGFCRSRRWFLRVRSITFLFLRSRYDRPACVFRPGSKIRISLFPSLRHCWAFSHTSNCKTNKQLSILVSPLLFLSLIYSFLILFWFRFTNF